MLAGDDPLTEVSFEREEVEEKLKKTKASVAPGPDKVWSRVLRDMADLLAGLLTIIFNKLIEGLPHLHEGAKGDRAVGQVAGGCPGQTVGG